MKRLLLFAITMAALMLSAQSVSAATPFEMRLPVLMYHHVDCWPGDPWPNRGLYVCPERFDEQMSLLASKGWTTVTTAELAQAMLDRTCLPPKTFVVTFDDGWLSGYSNAAPILEKYGFHGSFFATVGKMIDPPEGPTWKQHFDVAQAQDLVARGHLVGNHTLNHRSVSSMSDATRQIQITSAENLLSENGLEALPKTFVYPYGSYSDSAISYLAGDGYSMAFTTKSGFLRSTDAMLASPRTRVSRSTTAAGLLTKMNKAKQPCS